MEWFGSDAVEVAIKLSDLLIQHGACVEELQSYEWGNLLFNPNIELQRPFETSHALERLCKYLISINSDIEGRNKASQTPLLYSAYSCYPGSVNWLRSLIANGADLTARDAEGRGPFHELFVGFVDINRLYGTPGLVIIYRVFEEKANILLDAGCDPLQRDLRGHLPACFGYDKHIHALWQSVLRKKTGREVTSGECFCECGGLYELADISTGERETGLQGFLVWVKWRSTRITSLRRWKNGYKRGDVKMEEEGLGESRAGLGELGQDGGPNTGEGGKWQTKHVSEEDDGFEADEDLEGDDDWTGDEDREEDEGSEEEGDLEENDNLEDSDNMEVDPESEQDEEPEEIL